MLVWVTMSLAAFRDVAAAAARTYALRCSLWELGNGFYRGVQGCRPTIDSGSGLRVYSGIREGATVLYVPYSLDSGVVVCS